MPRKSAFNIKKSKDKWYPYSVTFQGIGTTRHKTKSEALKKLREGRKKERAWIKKNIK